MDIVRWLLENIFTFSPITQISLTGLFVFYVLYSLVSFLVSSPLLYLARKKKVESELKLKDILISVPIEECFFRFLPLKLLGATAITYAHFIWALLHGRIPTIVWCVVHGLLDLRLWLGGLWVEAVFIHLFHNLLCFAIYSSLKNSTKKEVQH